MTTYRLWQMNTKSSLSDNISMAIQNYIAKHGLPAQILEVSNQLGEPVVLPDGMNLITKSVRIPKNILLLGVEDENNNSW